MISSGFWNRRRVVLLGHTSPDGAWLAAILDRLNARVTALGTDTPSLFDAVAPSLALDDRRGDPADIDALRALVRDVDADVVLDLSGRPRDDLARLASPFAPERAIVAVPTPAPGAHILEALRIGLLQAEAAASGRPAGAAPAPLLTETESAVWTERWTGAPPAELAAILFEQTDTFLGLATRLTVPGADAPAEAAPGEAAALREEILGLVERYHAVAHRQRPFDPAKPSAPVSGRVYGANDMRTLVDSALDFWLTTGRFNAAFEKRLAATVGAKHALTVNSGSSANLVAFSALTSPKLGRRALQPGDEVITCATGFPTTVNPIIHWGMVPVFVDVSLPTYNIDVEAVAAAVTPRTRAIMVAHTLGNPFDVTAIKAICDRHDLFLIEDCCDALGATVGGRHVGTFGDVGTLSFYPAHHITMGEGGAVYTNSPRLNKIMESFRDWGRDCYCDPGCDNSCNKRFGWQLGDLPKGYDHKYIYAHLGFNLKITDMQASVGLAQLDHLDEFIARRRSNFDTLTEALRPLEELFILPEATPGTEPSWFGLPLTLRDGAPVRRDDLAIHLNAHGIGTRLLFGGNLIRQPYMKGRTYRVSGSLANADRVVASTLWLGVYPGLGEAAIGHMVEQIAGYCRGARRAVA